MQCWIIVVRDFLLRKRSLKSVVSLEVKLKLSLKTLTGKKSEELATVNDLIVSGVSYGKERPAEWIEVPKANWRSFL